MKSVIVDEGYKVFKYILLLKDFQWLDLPGSHQILSIQVQNVDQDRICLWALVDPLSPKVKVPFWIVGTGYPVPLQAKTYLTTLQLKLEGLVFHIFINTSLIEWDILHEKYKEYIK